MSSDGIYIRQYRPSDLPQIRDLLFEGFATSEGSIVDAGRRRAPFMRTSILAYLLGAAGLFLFSQSERRMSVATGVAALLCIAGIALFVAARREISHFVQQICEDALASDMRDITAHYCAPGGTFLVAARPYACDKGKMYGDAQPEGEAILGYVGLEYLPEKNPETADVRRMIISAKYRRQGLATQLMRVIIAHSKTLPRLRYLTVGTSDLQPAARRLYQGLGWELTSTEPIGNWLATRMYWSFRRPVDIPTQTYAAVGLPESE
ncbi:acyl-CoA N-acyltransferase [Mycena pura]|uniref:Acyl-CoA N-acyltransferase n=1 Tax=Mycena pura TaxID=153505 RepID=A0AAD6VT21_9AGAR|nr:acyl-CoA N-acyltransferase [Mycena pura]